MITYPVHCLNNLVVHMLYCATEDCCVWHIHIETSKSLSTEHLSAYGQSQAALFNQTEIALILMDSGANIQRKNGQGWLFLLSETVLSWIAYISQILYMKNR